MKKLIAVSLILVAIVSFAFQKKDSITPSQRDSNGAVSKGFSSKDTLDLDEQMAVLEKEMKVWEEKMKPFEEEMRKLEERMNPRNEEMRQTEEKMRPLEKEMRELERKMDKATSDTEREKISDDMEAVSKKMEAIGKEMEKVGNGMGDVGDEMGKIGEKMGEIGEEMGKVGEKMGKVGEKMEARHQKIFSWFFQELKRDGLIKEGKCSIILEKDFFVVNGQNLSAEQKAKYKKGIEGRLGKPLKEEFSIYFKGTLDSISDTGFEFSGTMNSDY